MLLLNEKTLPHKNFCQAVQQNNQICGRNDCKIHEAKIFLEKHLCDEKEKEIEKEKKKAEKEIEKEKKKAEKEIEKEKKKAGEEIEKEKKKAENEIEKEEKKAGDEIEKKLDEEIRISIPQAALPFPMFDRFGIPVSRRMVCKF